MNFDDIEIDLERFELRKGGAAVAVEPKVFDLIRFFAENPNRLISKDELIDTVWQGRIVSDAALSSAVKSARKALGDEGAASSRIRTIRGRGFLLELDEAPTEEASVRPSSSGIFVQPSLAVLLPEGAEGWGAEVQRRLSAAMGRVPFVTVAAPMLLRQINARGPADLARALGPGFALDISASGSGAACRMDGLLFDTATGNTIWSFETPRFDPEADLAEVLRDLVVRLEPQVVRATHAALSGKALPSDPRALTMQALGTLSLKGWNRVAFSEAEALLRKAVAVDEELPFAWAALSLITALGQEVGLAEPEPARRAEAIGYADRAVDLDGMSPLILGFAGCALCDAGQPLRGKTLLERALELDAGNPQAMAALGTQLLREGEVDRGVPLLAEAIASSARDTKLAVWRSVLAMAYLGMERLDDALEEARLAVAADDQTHLSRVVLTLVLLMTGDTSKAVAAWQDALRVTPDLVPSEMAGLIGRRGVEALTALSAG